MIFMKVQGALSLGSKKVASAESKNRIDADDTGKINRHIIYISFVCSSAKVIFSFLYQSQRFYAKLAPRLKRKMRMEDGLVIS